MGEKRGISPFNRGKKKKKKTTTFKKKKKKKKKKKVGTISSVSCDLSCSQNQPLKLTKG